MARGHGPQESHRDGGEGALGGGPRPWVEAEGAPVGRTRRPGEVGHGRAVVVRPPERGAPLRGGGGVGAAVLAALALAGVRAGYPGLRGRGDATTGSIGRARIDGVGRTAKRKAKKKPKLPKLVRFAERRGGLHRRAVRR
eukprot:4441521-Pyramimonas_sp.AAC.1